MNRLLTCLFVCVFIFCACSEKDCEHNATMIAHTYTCTENGTATYRCDTCGAEWVENMTASCEYPAEPSAVQGSYAYYICEHCENVKIVNENGLPVVPVD